MSANDRLQTMADKLSRRRLVSRLEVAAAGGVAWALGRTTSAAAVDYLCCHLCKYPSNPATCLNRSGCYAVWSWTCTTPGHWYSCEECFKRGYTPRGDSCNGVVCSFVYEYTPAPAP